MILELEAVFLAIAAILSLVSLITLRAIRRLGVGRSFWIPVFVSSIVFLAGSIFTILYEAGFSLLAQTVEVVQVSRILALCILTCGIYTYSRRVRSSLREEFSIPEQIVRDRLGQAPVEGSFETEAPIREEVQETRVKESSEKETAQECKHGLGYLKALPKNTPIPEECLTCDRIIECKHTLVKTIESSHTH